MIFLVILMTRIVNILWFRRRESTDVEDLFIAHISGMDTMARGLRNAAKLIEVNSSCSPSFNYCFFSF